MRASTRSAAIGSQAAKCRPSTTFCCPGRIGLALSPGRLPRALRHRRHLGRPVRREADRAQAIPITIAGMSLRRPWRPTPRRPSAGACSAMGTSTTTGDGGMIEEERPGLEDPGLPGAAVPLRPQSRRHAPRRRPRGGHRPGRQARRRRRAARPSKSPTGSPTCATCRIGIDQRSACQPSRLDRTRRPGDQVPGAARGHRLATSDLRQDRRHPGVQVRRRPLRSRRGPTSSSSTACRPAPRRPRTSLSSTSASRPWPPTRLRPSMRCLSWTCTAPCNLIVSGGIRSGADVAKALALGRRCGLYRHGGADRAWLQQAGIPSRTTGPSAPSPATATTAIPAAVPVGITTQEAHLEERLKPRAGGALAQELPARS